MTAEQIDAYLHRYFLDGYKYQISNSYIFDWECDFFAISKSGYSYEVEVKVSRSDFFADFNKKRKHRILGCSSDKVALPLSRNADIVPNMDKWEYREDGYYHYENKKLNRHARKKPPSTRFEFTPIKNICPNKFVFAVPEGLVSESEVPDYAGLMYICPRKGRRIYSQACKYIKQPPALHKKKPDFTRRLLKKFYWYYRNNRELPKTKSQVGIEQQQNSQN